MLKSLIVVGVVFDSLPWVVVTNQVILKLMLVVASLRAGFVAVVADSC